MPTQYRVADSGKIVASATNLDDFDSGVIWVDALNPSDGDLARLDRIMGFEVPNRHDITEIELSNRLYKEDDALVMIANLLPKDGGRATPPRPAAFILKRNLLLTIRYSQFFSFERVALRPPTEAAERTPIGIFLRLLEEAVADRADNLENSMRYMEMLTSQLFVDPTEFKPNEGPEPAELDNALRHIGRMGESVANIRESITSLQRVVNYAKAYLPDPWLGEQKPVLDSLRNDLTALSDEAGFFMNKLSFNLDAILGMINIEESKIIRLLSVVTLLLSPPMVIAGIYGMNFDFMPELHWSLGYGFALGLMLMTAVGSIWYLKRKRWM